MYRLLKGAKALHLVDAVRVSRASLVKSSFSTITPFKLADIGEGIAEVELMKWFVKEGDAVKSFDRLCEVQSDKATVEITSRYNGIIHKIYHEEGAIVKVGDSLLDILDSAAKAGGAHIENKAPEKAAAVVKAVETAAPVASSHTHNAHNADGSKIQTTPAVRKIAKENKVDLTRVNGTGPKGRILKEDVQQFIAGGHKSPTAAVETPVAAPATPAFVSGVDTKVPIRGVGRLMVKSMTAANQVPHLTLSEEIVFDNLKRLRVELNESLEKTGVKLSYMPLIIKATSLALLQYPQLNASVNAEVTEVTYHGSHNIGVAMDTPKGLIVPVIKNVQNMSVLEIAAEMVVLQKAAVAGTLKESQLNGGTFSLSNIGSIGGTYAVPVIVVPQVVIGAFGRLQTVPRYVNKSGKQATDKEIDHGLATVAPTSIMAVSWSADHRVVDGATVARFSNLWKKYLENPSLMISQLK